MKKFIVFLVIMALLGLGTSFAQQIDQITLGTAKDLVIEKMLMQGYSLTSQKMNDSKLNYLFKKHDISTLIEFNEDKVFSVMKVYYCNSSVFVKRTEELKTLYPIKTQVDNNLLITFAELGNIENKTAYIQISFDTQKEKLYELLAYDE